MKRIFLMVAIFLFSNVSLAKTNAEICGDMSCKSVFSNMKKFAKNGSPRAQAVLSLMYRGGHGTEVNDKLSLKYMKRAARAGFAFAEYDLAMIYKFGYVVDKDQEESVRWLKRSAEGGFQRAINLLQSYSGDAKNGIVDSQSDNKKLELDEGEEVLTVTSEKLTLTDLVDLLRSAGYGSNKQTGSRIKGKGCGKNMSKCVAWRINTPLGNAKFSQMISTINAIDTAILVASRGIK